MSTKKEKIKELIGLMDITNYILESTMKSTGCDGKYAEKYPFDYITMVKIYKEAVNSSLLESFSESIENEELLDKIIKMHKSEEYKIFNKAINIFIKLNTPFIIASRIIDNEEIPMSFMIYINEKTKELVKDKPIHNSYKELQELENILKTMTEDHDCNCAECDLDNCTSKHKIPKRTLIN
jgi:hypothetical protein